MNEHFPKISNYQKSLCYADDLEKNMEIKKFIKLLPNKEKLPFILGLGLQNLLTKWSPFQRLAAKKRFIFDCNNIGFKYSENENFILLTAANKAQIFLRINTSDIDVFKQVYIGNEYKPVIDVLLLNGFVVDTVVDLGSNIGLSALKFLAHFNPSKLICLEPDPTNYNVLSKNLANFDGTTILLQNAIWNKKETLFIDSSFRDGKEWSRGVGKHALGIAVEGITLKDIMQDNDLYTIDLLKIDIEGTEAIILNPENDLSFLNNVRVIAVEIHDEYKCREMIYNVLKEKKFTLINTGELTIGIRE